MTMIHGNLQASMLIHKYLDLVNVDQQVIIIFYLMCEELATNKKNVQQDLRHMNVSKGFMALLVLCNS